MKNKKIKKGYLISGIGAAIASISLAFAALSTPAEEFQQEKENEEINDPNKLVLPVKEETNEKVNILDKIPSVIKSVICVCLWAIGTIIIKLLKAVASIVVAPVLSFILGWLIIFGILFLIVLICLKLLFPDKKLSELLTKRIIITTIIGSLIIQTSNTFLPLFIKDYEYYEFTIIFIIGLIFLMIILIPEVIKDNKKPVIVYELDGKKVIK